MGGRLRARARSLLKQLEVDGATYRDQIERELAERLMEVGAAGPEASGASTMRLSCSDCGASNERDAKFCKACGAAL